MSNWKWLKNAKRNKMSESFYLFYAIAHQTFFTVIINFLKMPFAVVIFMKYFRCTAKTLQNIRTSFRLHITSYCKLKIVSIVIFYNALSVYTHYELFWYHKRRKIESSKFKMITQHHMFLLIPRGLIKN